ncbi:hypothetical protein ElyMa_005314500 [Elysia marginata]|uniref:Uncharacterized protein n=1 Tax=Elysia marginata TaxID=1093978 RepID=A0AAV4K1M9_9GAST|nr:hypothetical protein ElyMa_005314500 [Elysia marginata]
MPLYPLWMCAMRVFNPMLNNKSSARFPSVNQTVLHAAAATASHPPQRPGNGGSDADDDLSIYLSVYLSGLAPGRPWACGNREEQQSWLDKRIPATPTHKLGSSAKPSRVAAQLNARKTRTSPCSVRVEMSRSCSEAFQA